jgi:hypothetical protein
MSVLTAQNGSSRKKPFTFLTAKVATGLSALGTLHHIAQRRLLPQDRSGNDAANSPCLELRWR